MSDDTYFRLSPVAGHARLPATVDARDADAVADYLHQTICRGESGRPRVTGWVWWMDGTPVVILLADGRAVDLSQPEPRIVTGIDLEDPSRLGIAVVPPSGEVAFPAEGLLMRIARHVPGAEVSRTAIAAPRHSGRAPVEVEVEDSVCWGPLHFHRTILTRIVVSGRWLSHTERQMTHTVKMGPVSVSATGTEILPGSVDAAPVGRHLTRASDGLL